MSISKYRKAWELLPELKQWLGPAKDTTKAFCKYCRLEIIAHRSALMRHNNTKKHKDAIKLSKEGCGKLNSQSKKHFSSYEEKTLLSLVEKYKNVIENTDGLSWIEKEATWETIQKEFCSRTATSRTPKKLLEKYEKIKKKSRIPSEDREMCAEIKSEEIFSNFSDSDEYAIEMEEDNVLSYEQLNGLFEIVDASELNKSKNSKNCTKPSPLKLNKSPEHNDEFAIAIEEDNDLSYEQLNGRLETKNCTKSSPLKLNKSSKHNDEFAIAMEEDNDLSYEQLNGRFETNNCTKPSPLKLNKSSKHSFVKKRKAGIIFRAAKAKAVFFENEEKRAVERHTWELKLQKKQMELLNLKIVKERVQNQLI